MSKVESAYVASRYKERAQAVYQIQLIDSKRRCVSFEWEQANVGPVDTSLPGAVSWRLPSCYSCVSHSHYCCDCANVLHRRMLLLLPVFVFSATLHVVLTLPACSMVRPSWLAEQKKKRRFSLARDYTVLGRRFHTVKPIFYSHLMI